MPLASQAQRDERDGEERKRGYRDSERELGQKEMGWNPLWSFRGVINLRVVPVSPLAQCPRNLASSGGGRAEVSKGTLTVRRERER